MNKKANGSKLLKYGFKKQKNSYTYKTDIINGDFTLKIEILPDSEIKTELIENSIDEVYTLHLVEGVEGTFVGQVKKEYQSVLDNIISKCFDVNVFNQELTYKIMDYAKQKYNTDPEYLWEKFPENAVLRRQDNQKWYAAILTVKRSKLGFENDESVEVIDLRVSVDDVVQLTEQKNIYPAYHMNKKHWITIILDGSMDFEEICKFLDKSYKLALK